MEVKVTTPSIVRGAGVTAAMLVPGHNRFSRLVRSAAVAAGYLGSFAVEPDKKPSHYTLMTFKDPQAADPSAPTDEVTKYGNLAIGTASWIGIGAVLGHLAQLVPLPKVLKATALGGAVAVGDSYLGDKVRAGKATESR